MIKKIEIKDIATFSEDTQNIENLNKINFFFGVNGTGKTTISRIIADENEKEKKYPSCKVEWTDDKLLDVFVYNRDFIKENFGLTDSLRGVFTLGKKEKETEQNILALDFEIKKLSDEIKKLEIELDGNDGAEGQNTKIKNLNNYYQEKIWTKKVNKFSFLKDALKGYHKDKKKYMNKIIEECSFNKNKQYDIENLKDEYSNIFNAEQEKLPFLSNIHKNEILSQSQKEFLKKKIIGKEDVNFATIIKKLGNSGWVKEGRSFLDSSENKCPFCQQILPKNFEMVLSEYFSETYENDLQMLKNIIADYISKTEQLQRSIEEILKSNCRFFDSERIKIKKEKENLDSNIKLNIKKLEEKQKEPILSIELEPLDDMLNTIYYVIKDVNEKIKEQNNIIENVENAKKKFITNMWGCLANEYKEDIEKYNKEKIIIEKKIESLELKITKQQRNKSDKQKNREKLDKQLTSIEPTKNAINNILCKSGFKSFSLACCENKRSYKLIRENGDDAVDTLSEGEKNFITFLYFYNLLKGSQKEDGRISNKIVVFDDPVSSLDNDILFIISTLIRSLYKDIVNDKSYIRQIFILTHNVYFYKEVSLDHGITNTAKKFRYWTIEKNDNVSQIEKFTRNPIKSIYDMLWGDIKKAQKKQNINPVTLPNTMRRILEYYFRFVAGVNINKLPNYFEDQDKIFCQNLCTWVNFGSHADLDDCYCIGNNDQDANSSYLRIFRDIFEKTGHISHYNLKMGIDNKEKVKTINKK